MQFYAGDQKVAAQVCNELVPATPWSLRTVRSQGAELLNIVFGPLRGCRCRFCQELVFRIC